jgi:hypothetical protein
MVFLHREVKVLTAPRTGDSNVLAEYDSDIVDSSVVGQWNAG